MPTSVDIKNLKINKLTEAQYDAAVQGGVIGENELSVLTDAELEQIQVSALPTASADELGNIYQYVGATDANYTNGYFYKCVSDGQSPATYSWAQVNVQPAPSGLPDQTGQSGKFLTTNGTDASWATLNALQNTATGTNSLTINGIANTQEGGINIGIGSTGWKHTVSLGSGAAGGDEYVVSIGAGSSASQKRSIAIGHRARATAQHAIQIGSPANETTYLVNSDANTFKVGNANGNFELMSADGTIPKERLVNAVSKPSTMPELTVAGWSLDSGTNKYTQSVSVTGVTGTNTVFVSPAPSSAADYASSSVLCISQTTDSLTFQADSVPANAITVNVVIMG